MASDAAEAARAMADEAGLQLGAEGNGRAMADDAADAGLQLADEGYYSNFRTVGETSAAHAKYDGICASVGYTLVMAPMDMGGAGVYDIPTEQYSVVWAHGETSNRKFSGCVAVGDKVYFAPHHASSVGVLRVSSAGSLYHAFSSVPIQIWPLDASAKQRMPCVLKFRGSK